MEEIKFKNVTYSINKEKIINNLSFEIKKNEMVSIVGESGAGKSTTLNLISGLIQPTNGEIVVSGIKNPNYRLKEGRELLNSKISFIFQNFVLLDEYTVEQNFKLVTEYVKSKIKYEDALEKVGLKKSILKKKVYMLSGGEQQRVAIARNLLKESKIILADEPTGSLDPSNRDLVLSLLKKLNEEGNTIVIVTHDEYVKNFCERCINL